MKNGVKLTLAILLSMTLLTSCAHQAVVKIHCPSFPTMPATTAELAKEASKYDPATKKWIIDLSKLKKKLKECS